MYRFILCAILCGSTLMASAELYRDKLKEAESPKLLADAVSRISSRLRFSSDDVFSLAQSAFPDAGISGSEAFLKISSGNFSERWKAACCGLSADEASKRLFSELGEILGTSDAQSQTDRLGVIEAGLRERHAYLVRKAESTKRLYTALGALSGIGIAIMTV